MIDSLQVGYASADSAAHVRPDEALPTTGANGRTLSWASSSPAVLSPAGAVHAPSSPHAINDR
ncbi:immunoglobulin-like domain-containing protein [Paenibacillus filicis]|uniref:immunoglobulin-like domain-containing protein n=1 Tax=Paenibacillus filicis TaxID=669464 RepID=UPI003BF9661F